MKESLEELPKIHLKKDSDKFLIQYLNGFVYTNYWLEKFLRGIMQQQKNPEELFGEPLKKFKKRC